jgi:hypothetical protein
MTLPLGRDADQPNGIARVGATVRCGRARRRWPARLTARLASRADCWKARYFTHERGRIDTALRRPIQLLGVRKATAMFLAACGVVATAGAIHARERHAVVFARPGRPGHTQARQRERDHHRRRQAAPEASSRSRVNHGLHRKIHAPACPCRDGGPDLGTTSNDAQRWLVG